MKLGSTVTALASTAAVLLASVALASTAAAAPPTTLYAAPAGDGEACSEARPCSLDGAQTAARELAASSEDVAVVLAGGTYRISAPLEFRAEDGGRDGHQVTWMAAPGTSPVITGATPITGWSVHDAAAGIYVADTPPGLDTRQLYVDGSLAQRATQTIARDDIQLSATGMTITNPALAYLAQIPASRVEFESKGDFTDRYAPVESIDGNEITMSQPAWDNNTWGYDTVQRPIIGHTSFAFQNSLRFLDTAGEWYIDPAVGHLYYKPASGTSPADLDIELPRLESLVSIGGTYDTPVSNLTFQGITFTGTSWLQPSTEGYASQQNGSFMNGVYPFRPADAFTSCQIGCEAFERARTAWFQQPAAVQVSAASNVTFTRNTFTNLGSSALGVGNDANATTTGVGLGAQNITIDGNRFVELAGHGVFIGGNRADAHHPSDPRMTNQDITVSNNTVTRAALDYKDHSGILSTYVTRASIVHNEVSHVAYDGIDTGYGWGTNDPGGNPVYDARGYYNWNPRYDTPTTLRDNLVAGNLIHHTKSQFADGGSIYNLSASPGSRVEENYLYAVSGIGLYLDEASRYVTMQRNVLSGAGPWVFTNVNGPTRDNTIRGNWYNSGWADLPSREENNNQLIDNIAVEGTNWPAGAQEVICGAGVAPELRTPLNANLFSDCAGSNPVAAPLQSTGTSAVSSYFGQSGSLLGLRGQGADIWEGGGLSNDAYASIFQPDSVTASSSVSARVEPINDSNPWAKSGVVVRNDLTQPGESLGYAAMLVTARNGVVFSWDSDGDGLLDALQTVPSVDTSHPIWVKVTRSGTTASGYYSEDGVTWTATGAPVTLVGAADVQDGGIISSSHDANASAINVFGDLQVTGDTSASVTPVVTSAAPANAAGWHSAPVDVTFTATGTGVVAESRTDTGAWSVTQPVRVTAQGATTVQYRAVRDGAAVDGSSGEVVVNLDSVAPATTVSTTPASGTAQAGQTVTATFAGADATSGVARTEYSIDNGATWTTATPAGVSFTAAGQHAVLYRSVDVAGNTETARTATLAVAASNTARVTITSAGAPTAAGWYGQDVLVRLEAPTAGQKVQYRVNGGSWRNYSSSVAVRANGTTTIDHRLLASNVVVAGSESQVQLKIDKTAPAVTAIRTPEGGTGTPRNPIAVQFTATDAHSGVDTIRYRVNDGDWQASPAGEVTFGAVGDYVITYAATDKAGNSTAQRSLTFSIQPNAQTRIATTSSAVRQGYPVTFVLTGYARWDTVTVAFAGTPVATVMTDQNGNARVTVRIPAQATPGSTALSATGTDPAITASGQITVRR